MEFYIKVTMKIVVAGLLLFARPDISMAACWDITETTGNVIRASEVWHIYNKLSGKGIFMGKLDNADASIVVEEIKSITVRPAEKGWLNILRDDDAKGEIVFNDGRKSRFETDLNLFFRTQDKKQDIPFTRVKSIVRCKEPIVAAAERKSAGPGVPTQDRPAAAGRPDVDVIRLRNGDVLNGTVLNGELLWKAPYATVTVETDHVWSMTLVRKGRKDGLLKLRSGDEISGDLLTSRIRIKLVIGQTIEIETGHLLAIRFGMEKL